MRDAPEEFEALFRADYARLTRGLASFGDGAEEAVQEAFVKALVRWSHVSRLDDPAGGFAGSRFVSFSTPAVPGRARFAATARLGRTFTDPENIALLDVSDAVRRLSRRQRIAVGLRYGGGYPIGEVAEAMGLSEGGVKAHLFAARERLRAALSEDRDG